MVREFSTRVAGIYYCKGSLAGLRSGDSLRLIREPQNPYDPNAIRVETMELELLGWIPKTLTPTLARAMDLGLTVAATIAATTQAESGVRTVSTASGKRKAKRISGITRSSSECYILVTVSGDDTQMLDLIPPSPPLPVATQSTVLSHSIPTKLPSPPIAPKSSCFIATAVFGDAEHPTVATLRRWRDTKLQYHHTGRLFIQAYEIVGPYLAKHIRVAAHLRRLLIPTLNTVARIVATGQPADKSKS